MVVGVEVVFTFEVDMDVGLFVPARVVNPVVAVVVALPVTVVVTGTKVGAIIEVGFRVMEAPLC